MKKMIMHMRQETVDEFLKRGGTVTKIPEVLDTVGSWWGYQERYQAESIKDGTQQVVSGSLYNPMNGLTQRMMTENTGTNSTRDVTHS